MIETLNRLFEKSDPPVLFAYIFGSTGTELQHPQSDLDIAVYIDVEPSAVELNHKLSLYADVSRATKRNDVDVVLLNTCTNNILLYEIMTRGRLIYEADYDARVVYEQRALHSAIDFKEQRERIFV
jgi:predicted nucleotidyltransferase